MKRGQTKPYEEKKRHVAVTLPNKQIDAIEADMELKGETNLSKKMSDIIDFWVEHRGIAEAGSADYEINRELARFEGFSSSVHFSGKQQ